MEFWINGRLFSPHDLPSCIAEDEYACDTCEFFVPETCPLRRDPAMVRENQTLLRHYRERLKAINARQQAILIAAQAELHTHGRPLHYMVLIDILEDRYPDLKVNTRNVLRVLSCHPEIFEKVTDGVYGCR